MVNVREVLLAADPRIEESLKWKSPTYGYRGNLVSIDPHAKRHVSLLFHRGATIPGTFPSLEGGGAVARYMRLADASELEARSDELRAIAVAWCDMKDGGRSAPA
jgi:hypothetical protein